MASIKLGQLVKDVITGFQGIAQCRMEYLNGCVRFYVQPKAFTDKDGKLTIPDSQAFDEEQLEIVGATPIKMPGHRSSVDQTGGDRQDPPRR